MPYAIRESGLIFGCLLLIFVGLMTYKSLNILVQSATVNPHLKLRQVSTYEDLLYYPFGIWGRGFILLSMFVFAYGAMIAYLIIIKDTIPTILGFDKGFEREVVLLITGLIFIFPLAIQRDMATLSFTSFISSLSDVVLVVFIVVYSPIRETVAQRGGIGEILKEDSIKPTAFVGLGIISIAMCCQHSSFLIYGSLENHTAFRWKIVTGISISLATFLSVLLGVSGHLGFMEHTEGDILNNFPTGSTQANVARALLALTMVFTYPMEFFVGRHVLVDLFHSGQMEDPNESGGYCLVNCIINRRERLTVFLYILTMIPALIFDDLGPVLSVTGAVGGSCLSYIGPGLVFIGVNGDAFLEWAGRLLGYKKEPPSIELSAVGSASQNMTDQGDSGKGHQVLQLPVAGEQVHIIILQSGCKPLWWYILGFPIWTWVASNGSMGMKKRLACRPLRLELEAVGLCQSDAKEKILSPPSSWDFLSAVFFIVFGIIGLSAGLASNIYIQLNKFAFQ